MGFTIKEKAFLLDYFRKMVKQENEDRLALLCTPLHRRILSQMSEPDGIGYQQVYQCLKIIVPNFSKS
jgi:hypothetical protein